MITRKVCGGSWRYFYFSESIVGGGRRCEVRLVSLSITVESDDIVS